MAAASRRHRSKTTFSDCPRHAPVPGSHGQASSRRRLAVAFVSQVSIKMPSFEFNFAPAVSLFTIPPVLFWTYFCGGILTLIGLAVILRYDTPRATGINKLLHFGRLFFAVPMAVFAAEHFTSTTGISKIVPTWMPGHVFWTYFVGTCLFAAALSITIKRYAGPAALLLGLMFFLFVLMIHIPNFAAHPDRFTLAVPLRDLSFSGAALAFAGAELLWDERYCHQLIMLGRLFIGITALAFGVLCLLHPAHVPAVPLERVTPHWIPGRLLWTYFSGAVSLVAGLSLLANHKARLAALGIGLMVLLVMLVVYLPIEVAAPADVANALNYFADTLMYGGGALLLAQALAPEVAEIPAAAAPGDFKSQLSNLK